MRRVRGIMSSWLFVDFDGTLVDSLPALKRTFFLLGRRWGLTLRAKDFDRYNGPSLKAILRDMKSRYSLPQSIGTLLNEYNQELEAAYKKLSPRPGAMAALRRLRRSGWKIALVTSAPRQHVEAFLKSSSLKRQFKFVVSGDEVAHAKPSPDLYLLAKKKAGRGYYVALEDSESGAAAARRAGVVPFRFSRERAFFSIGSFAELSDRFVLISRRPFVRGTRTRLRLESDDQALVIPSKIEKAVARAWRRDIKVNPRLFDGQSFAITSEDRIREDGAYKFRVSQIPFRYAHYSVTHSNGEFLGFCPVAVTGVLVQGDRLLIGRRSKHSSGYAGALELVPAGSMSPRAKELQRLSPIVDLYAELAEELSLGRRDVLRCYLTGMILSVADSLIDFIYTIELKPDAVPIVSDEHHEILALSRRQLKSKLTRSPKDLHPYVSIWGLATRGLK